MTRHYYVEIKLQSKNWTLLKVFTRYTDAIQFVKETLGERYLMRIVRVTREVMLGEKR